MAVLRDKKHSSSQPPPSTAASNRGRPPRPKSSSLTQVQMTKSMIVHANPIMSERNKPKRFKRATVESLYDTFEAQASVLERAKEVEANLNSKFPTLVKVMLPSHVTRVFWLGLPTNFCCDHMPKDDTTFVLEDENGEEFETKYLAHKVGLSGGWRAFSIAHKLVEGDVVIFHLVTPSKFKVYIVRSNGLDDMDSALGLMRLEACTPMDIGDSVPCESEEIEYFESIPGDKEIAFDTKSVPACDQLENDSEDLGFECVDELRISESVVTFEEVKCLENFNVLVNGLIINSEFSKHVLTKYYELCCSQNSFLHEHLLEGLNCKLIAGVISETINIADAIKTCKITTTEEDFSTWDRTLKAFEDLGLNVRFLRHRLNQLGSLASKSKRSEEARLEKLLAEEEMRSLEEKLLEVKDRVTRLDSEIETLKTSSENLEVMFQELANATW